MKKKILIEGMSCMNCVGHIKKALEALDGVTSVEINFTGKYALVESTVSDNDLKNTIEEEGYDVIKIEEI